jgi:hypothetical protein
MPSRLIELLPLQNSEPEWRLRKYPDEVHKTAEYVTLSHRWGSAEHLQLKKENISALREGQLLSDLPPKYRDAITIAKRFAVKYIWIDSLCIVQDSEVDWRTEAAQMGNVYANSLCNIAMALEYHTEEEYFSTRNSHPLPSVTTRPAWFPNFIQDYTLVDPDLWSSQIHQCELNYRGWVAQERFLSPRIVYVTEQQLFWECEQVTACEELPNGEPESWRTRTSFKNLDQLLSKQDNHENEFNDQNGRISDALFELWEELITDYSFCHLTKKTDRLIAFSGIAQLFQRETGDIYLAGLWKSRLKESLLWNYCRNKPTVWGLGTDNPRSQPSWTWASIEKGISTGPVRFRRATKVCEVECRDNYTEVIDAQTYSVTEDVTGEIKGGLVKLKGPIIHATYKGVFIVSPEEHLDEGHIMEIDMLGCTVIVEILPDTAQVEPEEGTTLTCLPFSYYRSKRDGLEWIVGLMLQPTCWYFSVIKA